MTYGALYLDPPWSFKTYSGKQATPHRCAEDHYSTMSLKDIQALPIDDWAAQDCALFMWCVDSHIDVAIDTIRAYGFQYKTKAFTWVKTAKSGDPRIGMGYWTRKSAEICLLATKGKPKRKSKGVREVLLQPRREHSRKPDDFYGRIEALVDGPYLEVFARQAWPGWDQIGDQTDKFEVAA